MSSFPILDLIAGMIFIYFLLSVINNSLVELLFAVLKTRAFNLKNWIIQTFSEPSNWSKYTHYFKIENNFHLPNQLLNHPLLTGSSKTNKSPSYMDAKSFAVAVIEIANNGKPLVAEGIDFLNNLKGNIAQNNNLPKPIKDMVIQFIERTQLQKQLDSGINELKLLEEQIESWFNNAMQRLSGKLKRWSLFITLIFGTFLCSFLNIDSISIAKYLYNNPEANAKLAAAAMQEAKDSAYYHRFILLRNNLKDTTQRNSLDSLMIDGKAIMAQNDYIQSYLALAIPMGWTKIDSDKMFKDANFTLSKIGGIIITILALLLGAPFWFDVLGKVANLRSSLKPKSNPTNPN